MKISHRGISLIKEFEGLRLTAYYCSASTLTIGYGHTKNVKRGDRIDEKQAECYLRQDLHDAERAINKLVRVNLTKNQYDALCSLIFNIGIGAFSRSTLLAKLNKDDKLGAANEFKRWNKAGRKELAGLVRRRHAEYTLFVS